MINNNFTLNEALKDAKILVEHAVERKQDCIYFLDKQYNIHESRVNNGVVNSKSKIIVKNIVNGRQGFLYFIDSEGNVCEIECEIIHNEKEENIEMKKQTQEEFYVQMIEEVKRLVKQFEKTESPTDACKDFIYQLVTELGESHFTTVGILTETLFEWRNRSEEVLRDGGEE